MKTKESKTYARSGISEAFRDCDGYEYNFPGANVADIYDNYVSYGENYPDWRERLARGFQCTTFLEGRHYKASDSPIQFISGAVPRHPYVCETGIFTWTVSGSAEIRPFYNYGIGPFSGNASETKADNLAKSRFVNKIRAAQTTLQGGVVLGELKESLRMLVSPAKSLRKGLASYLGTLKKRRRQVKRVSPRKRLSTARRVLADTWLEYSFGWRPLLSDIDNAAKLLADRQLEQPVRTPVTAIGVDEHIDFVSEPVYTNMHGTCNVNWKLSEEHKVVYRGSVSARNPVTRGWRQSGLSLDNFVPTVWELIPYSFLVDYFINVDDIINAVTLRTSDIVWMARTHVLRRATEAVEVSATPHDNDLYELWAFATPVLPSRTNTSFSRAPYTGSLVPSLTFTVPGFSTKWINMAALLFGARSMTPFHR